MKRSIHLTFLAPALISVALGAPTKTTHKTSLIIGEHNPKPRTNPGDWISPVAFTTIPGIPAGTQVGPAPSDAAAHSSTSHDWMARKPCGCAEDCDCSADQHQHHEDHAHHDHPFAPIGVMADHTHAAGELMLSYRYMFMRMEQNYSGSDTIGDGTFAGPPPAPFRVAPTDMDMQMHMFGLMYAPTDRLTLMGMLNFVDLSMNHVNRMNGVRFRTEASGLGDSSLTALFRFWDGPSQTAHAGLGLLLPTAEVDKQDVIPGPGNTRLPYPMQLGAGSWGLAPSLTYLGHDGDWSWGGQVSARIYLSDNDEGYRLGNRGEATVWGARRINDWIGLSARLIGSTWGNVTGRDNDLLPLPVPTADPKRRGGTRLDGSVGLRLKVPNTGARIGIEFGLPLWQDLDGPQLGVEWWTMLGVQYAF